MIIKPKDTRWYILSGVEAAMIAIAFLCWIGLIVALFLSLFHIKMASTIAGWSGVIYAITFLIHLSWEKDWRREYRDDINENEYD